MLDTTANNIANVNTYGYKASTVAFKDMLSQTIQGASGPTASLGGTNARQIGLGMQVDSITQRHTQGAIQTTGVISDIAISGDGFFRVSNDGGNLPIANGTLPVPVAAGNEPSVVYQRAGNFKLDGNGDLVTSDGYFVVGYAPAVSGAPVLPTDPPAGTPTGLPDPNVQVRLRVDPATTSSYSISQDGEVTRVDTAGVLQTVGWVSLAKFANPSGLQQIGNNKWEETVNSGLPADGVARQNTGPGTPPVPTNFLGTELVSGSLEMSNVDLATEFTEMIRAQRGFQANSRIITTSDEILQELVNLKR
jgi:flagellar hook protein FlgE